MKTYGNLSGREQFTVCIKFTEFMKMWMSALVVGAKKLLNENRWYSKNAAAKTTIFLKRNFPTTIKRDPPRKI